MASQSHAIQCPKCGCNLFREEKLIEIDSSVVIRDELPVTAKTVKTVYRYICSKCNEILEHK